MGTFFAIYLMFWLRWTTFSQDSLIQAELHNHSLSIYSSIIPQQKSVQMSLHLC